MSIELVRNQTLVITRTDGTIEHGIFAQDGNGPVEHLVHVAVLPSGHATVIDYNTHTNSAGERRHPNPDPPEIQAAKAKKFLELGGEKMLGHPMSPQTGVAEAAKLRARHKLAD